MNTDNVLIFKFECIGNFTLILNKLTTRKSGSAKIKFALLYLFNFVNHISTDDGWDVVLIAIKIPKA